MKAILPKPPSINHIYAYTCQGGHARSYMTKEGKEWFEEAGWKLKSQMKVKDPINSSFEIWIKLMTAYRQDVDNVLKPILDLLTKQHIITDDSLCYKLDIEKEKVKKEDERIEIEILGY